MNRIFVFLIISTTLLSVSYAGDQSVILKIGPVWPRDLLGTKHSTAWDATILTGATFDRRVTIGGGLDFLWNVTSKETQVGTNEYRVDMKERTIMFPISGYLSLTPLPDLKVTPSLSTQLGLNTMYYYKKQKDENFTPDPTLKDRNGWYMGFYWKLALDAVVSVSENVRFFVGLEYQHSKPKKLGNRDNDTIFRRNMSGIGIRAGLNIAR